MDESKATTASATVDQPPAAQTVRQLLHRLDLEVASLSDQLRRANNRPQLISTLTLITNITESLHQHLLQSNSVWSQTGGSLVKQQSAAFVNLLTSILLPPTTRVEKTSSKTTIEVIQTTTLLLIQFLTEAVTTTPITHASLLQSVIRCIDSFLSLILLVLQVSSERTLKQYQQRLIRQRQRQPSTPSHHSSAAMDLEEGELDDNQQQSPSPVEPIEPPPTFLQLRPLHDELWKLWEGLSTHRLYRTYFVYTAQSSPLVSNPSDRMPRIRSQLRTCLLYTIWCLHEPDYAYSHSENPKEVEKARLKDALIQAEFFAPKLLPSFHWWTKVMFNNINVESHLPNIILLTDMLIQPTYIHLKKATLDKSASPSPPTLWQRYMREYFWMPLLQELEEGPNLGMTPPDEPGRALSHLILSPRIHESTNPRLQAAIQHLVPALIDHLPPHAGMSLLHSLMNTLGKQSTEAKRTLETKLQGAIKAVGGGGSTSNGKKSSNKFDAHVSLIQVSESHYGLLRQFQLLHHLFHHPRSRWLLNELHVLDQLKPWFQVDLTNLPSASSSEDGSGIFLPVAQEIIIFQDMALECIRLAIDSAAMSPLPLLEIGESCTRLMVKTVPNLMEFLLSPFALVRLDTLKICVAMSQSQIGCLELFSHLFKSSVSIGQPSDTIFIKFIHLCLTQAEMDSNTMKDTTQTPTIDEPHAFELQVWKLLLTLLTHLAQVGSSTELTKDVLTSRSNIDAQLISHRYPGLKLLGQKLGLNIHRDSAPPATASLTPAPLPASHPIAQLLSHLSQLATASSSISPLTSASTNHITELHHGYIQLTQLFSLAQQLPLEDRATAVGAKKSREISIEERFRQYERLVNQRTSPDIHKNYD